MEGSFVLGLDEKHAGNIWRLNQRLFVRKKDLIEAFQHNYWSKLST
jgi:hypothetical protein